MPGLTIIYTSHAHDALARRRIEHDWVERAIRAPDALEQDPYHPERMRAFLALPERDGRVLRVVYEREGDTIRVVTAFLDRGRRPKRRASDLRP